MTAFTCNPDILQIARTVSVPLTDDPEAFRRLFDAVIAYHYAGIHEISVRELNHVLWTYLYAAYPGLQEMCPEGFVRESITMIRDRGVM